MKQYRVIVGTNGRPEGSIYTSAENKTQARKDVAYTAKKYGQKVISVTELK